ncbi:MAG TPA: 2-oxo-4-hydroxy-4-carboxy-5-ureidoimidazoline decarboxylase [Woeseiaceae bacterium]|nr:2-oxo-4-hydroxy-4-carboxy-5-ureidoimidazoline decarboxylase [Woeseiaceae bacterium]
MDKATFIARYGGVYEHSPWVAEEAYERARRVTDPARLAEIMAACVDAADEATKLALIRAHPDLADRAAVGGLTTASGEEQASAGLDQCTPGEYARFGALNREYKAKFGFPFVMAVRGRHRREILAAFEQRLGNDRETELATAIREIHAIARLRLEAMEPPTAVDRRLV